MTDLILDNTYLILLLPLWIFLIIMCGRFFSVYVNKKITYVLTLLSSALGVLLCSVSLFNMGEAIEQSFPFIKVNNFVLSCGLYIDKPSLIIALTLFLVSFLVQAFSIPYMKNEKKNYRFFAYLNMFNFSMAGLLFSPNLFQMYVFWELVGVISYLLIGFDYKKEEKSQASKRVFIINRVGDTALLGGIILSSYFMYSYSNPNFATLSFTDMNAISTVLYAYTSTPLFYVICGLFIIATAVKSAQFPFYTWLQDAMEAKLPVSALLHSATMVIAGVYLLIRLTPFFSLENNILHSISILGLITAIICSVLATIEIHPKKVLAYSTSANLGLMILAVGMRNIKVAIIFLVAHAFIKSLLFLSLDLKESYIGYITFLIGALSLSGLLFSGMCTKEILFATLSQNLMLSIVFTLVSFLTAFYIMRLAILLQEEGKLENNYDIPKYLPIAGLLVLNIVFYFVIKSSEYKIAEPFYASLVGWLVVYIMYKKNWLTKLSSTPKLLEKFYNNTITKFYDIIANYCNVLEKNVFENYKPIECSIKFGISFVNFVETKIMNGSVKLITSLLKSTSELDSMFQSKNVQTYNAYGFILITATLCSVIFIIIYTIMLMGAN